MCDLDSMAPEFSMTVAADYLVKRTELLDKLGGILCGFRNAMIIDGAVAPQEYVAWWGGLDRGKVGGVERGQRDVQFKSLRRVLAAYNATWALFGEAMGDVDTIEIVPIKRTWRPRVEIPREISGLPSIRPLATILRDRRIELGQSQEAMGYIGGLDRGFVGTVERAERSVRFVKLRDVLAAYRLTWRELGQKLDERDPIRRYQWFPTWPGSRAILRGDAAPPWGPAADRARCVPELRRSAIHE
jgi:transcriptional regulator with XRE-family HTH domain